MYKQLTAGLLASGLIAGGVASGPASAAGLAMTDQLIEIQGSFKTADGVPYPYVRWVAQSTDLSITDRGMTDEAGRFAFLTSPGSDTRIAFDGYRSGVKPEPWHGSVTSPLDQTATWGLFCAPPDWSGSADQKGVPLTVPAGQSRLDIVTPRAHNATVLVTDKFGKRVHNAKVSPNSWAGGYFQDESSLNDGTHNYSACQVPNQWFGGVGGIDPTLKVGGWIPGRTGGSTESSGRALIATAGPLDPSQDFAVVSAEIRPGATQQTRVKASSLEGNDPYNRVAVAVLPFAPIMEDAATAGVVPGEATTRLRSLSSTTTPTVIVRQPTGQALPNTQVEIVPVLAGDTPTSPREGAVLTTAITGSDGKATFTGLPSGTYRAIPVNVSARTVDFTVSGAGDTQPPVTQPPATQPPVTQPPVTQPPVTQPPVTQPPVTQPPVTSRPAATVKVKAVKKKSKLKVDVNPNKGSGYWKFQVQKQRSDGSWKALKTYKTKGSKETRTINLKKGTYRVVVKPKYGYAGTISTEVSLRR